MWCMNVQLIHRFCWHKHLIYNSHSCRPWRYSSDTLLAYYVLTLCGLLPSWIPSFTATSTLTDVFLVEKVQQWLICHQRVPGHQGLHTDRHCRQHIVLTLHMLIYIIVIIFILIYISLHLYICLLSQNPVKFPERSLLFISSERFRNAFWQFL